MKRVIRVLVVLCLLVLLYGGVSIWGSANFLIERKFSVDTGKCQEEFVAVVISDLHDHEFGNGNVRLVEKIQDIAPDLILMDGDMLNETSDDAEVPLNLIRQLKDTAPVYYALGNHEINYMENGHPQLMEELENAGAVMLEREFVDIEVKNSRAYGLKIPQTAITEKEVYKIPLDFLTTGGDSADEGFYRETEAGGVSTIEFISPDILREETNEDGEGFCYVDMETLRGGDTLLLPDSNERFQVAETETLKGAYNINRGYAVFKYVDILDENSEYCIVRKNVAYSLRPYDHIVLNASMVSDQQIVR